MPDTRSESDNITHLLVCASDEDLRLAAIRAFGAAMYYRDTLPGRTAHEVVNKMLGILTPAMPEHVIDAAEVIRKEGL